MNRIPRIAHGGAVESAARRWGCAPEQVLDLSTGTTPPPSDAAQLLAQAATALGRYADPDGEPLRSALAAALRVPPDWLVITGGAQQAIEAVLHAMPWRTLTIETPCYIEPLRLAHRRGIALRTHAHDEAPPPADARWITCPHNPDGGLRALDPAGSAMLVLDESYLPLAARRRIGARPGWIRLGSLTKAFGCPGLPIGYLIASPSCLDPLRAALPPWPAAALAIAFGCAMLPRWAARDRAAARARRRLARLLADAGWQVRPSCAPFVLARPPAGNAPDFARARILVRRFPEWPTLRGWLRLRPPADPAGWRRLAAVIQPQRTTPTR